MVLSAFPIIPLSDLIRSFKPVFHFGKKATPDLNLDKNMKPFSLVSYVIYGLRSLYFRKRTFIWQRYVTELARNKNPSTEMIHSMRLQK